MKFIVYFSYISEIIYPWHKDWVANAKSLWPDHFLGVYLMDEPGGKQLDRQTWNGHIDFGNVTSYDEAAELYVKSLSGWSSAESVKDIGLGMYTSDYALFWFDYLTGYDVVFVELILESHDSVRGIALSRGDAGVQGKDWGAIVTYMGVVDRPPFLVSGTELFDEMVMAYHAGANMS